MLTPPPEKPHVFVFAANVPFGSSTIEERAKCFYRRFFPILCFESATHVSLFIGKQENLDQSKISKNQEQLDKQIQHGKYKKIDTSISIFVSSQLIVHNNFRAMKGL